MENKDKGVVELNPKDSAYRDKIAAARGVQHPLGGAPMPKIPNIAELQAQDRHAGVQARRTQGMAGLLSPEQQAQLEKNGQFISGVGSGYRANQPAAANLPPGGFQNPPRPEGGLSQATQEQLKAVAEANATAKAQEAVPTPEKLAEGVDDILDDEEAVFDELGRRIRDLLKNKERRVAIEGRCAPMNIADLILHKELRQVVPVVPGVYEPEFRTAGGDEDLYIKRLLSSERGMSTTYVLGKMSVMGITCSLFALNGKPLPSHIKDDDINDDLFKLKYRSVVKYPIQVLADLAVNLEWFDRRVRRLLVIDEIKGF